MGEEGEWERTFLGVVVVMIRAMMASQVIDITTFARRGIR